MKNLPEIIKRKHLILFSSLSFLVLIVVLGVSVNYNQDDLDLKVEPKAVDINLQIEDEEVYIETETEDETEDDENISKVDLNRDVIRLWDDLEDHNLTWKDYTINTDDYLGLSNSFNKNLPLINIATDADFKILNPFEEKRIFMFIAPVSGTYKFETTSKYNLPEIIKYTDGGIDIYFNYNEAEIPISEIEMIRKQARESFQNKEYKYSIEFNLEKNELYYIDFDDYYGINFTKPYPIYLRVTLPEYTDDVGDTFETAKNIFISDKQSVSHTRGFLGSESDIDFYKFTAQRSGLHTLNLSGLIDMQVILYDENKDILSKSSTFLSNLELETNHFYLNFNLSKGKTYYAKVLSSKSEIGVYDFKIFPPSNVPEAFLLYFRTGSDYTKERLYQLLYSKNSLPVNEFIILSGHNVDYARNSVISEKDIENLRIEMVGTKSFNDLDKIKQEYLMVLKEENQEIDNGIHADMEGFTTISLEIAKRLLKIEPHAKIWFSIPDVTILPLARNYERTYLEYIENIKKELDKIDASYWKNNVEGFYFATESVVQWYTDFDENNIFLNPVVNLMSKLSRRIRDQHSKKFLWMPYYSSSIENIKRIGIIANNINIFDYVIIQPNTFFDKMLYPNNITYVERSIRGNLVSYPNGELVSNKHYDTKFNNNYNIVSYPDGALVSNKASRTLIGAVMELGNRRGYNNDDKSVKEAYLEYVKAFGKYLGKKPIAFYADDFNYLIQDFQYELVREFFLGENY